MRGDTPGRGGGQDEGRSEGQGDGQDEGQGDGPGCGRGELDLGQCRSLIDELARMEVFQVNFGGGEPFLRADFLDIVGYAHSRGITTCVSTNGTVLTDALVGELLEMAPVYLQVSLDGACAETNDAIRGPGTFARIRAGIELLARRDYPDFSLNMVVTRLNASEIADFDRLARHYGAKTRLSRFRPSGAGCERWEDYRLTRDQLLALSSFLGDHPEILTGDSFFALTPESRRTLGLNMCGAAKMTCAVAPGWRRLSLRFPLPPCLPRRQRDGRAVRTHLSLLAGAPAVPGARGRLRAASATASPSATVAARRSRTSSPSPWTSPTRSACGR